MTIGMVSGIVIEIILSKKRDVYLEEKLLAGMRSVVPKRKYENIYWYGKQEKVKNIIGIKKLIYGPQESRIKYRAAY